MGFFRHIKDVMRFIQLPKEQRSLTFYSEGKNYWSHLEGLVKEVLNTSNIQVCYISSGEDDPGVFFEHPNYQTFKIDDGFVRNWLFENIETDVMVMTMPDIEQFQVKRSKHRVHYVYVQHSLVSLHMIYRKNAFNHYDTIFCAGPHHVKEVRALEQKYNLPSKNIVEHGYGRLDSILDKRTKPPIKDIEEPLHILMAPSWGESATIESGTAEEIVAHLLDHNYKVTLRPHPQTIKFSKKKVDSMLKKYKTNELFNYEENISGQESLHASDVMISDWSWAALDYALGLAKPVIFIDVPRKINNPDYKEIGIEPIEVVIREEIGAVVKLEDISNLSKTIEKVLQTKINNNTLSANVFNPRKSSFNGCKTIKELLNEK